MCYNGRHSTENKGWIMKLRILGVILLLLALAGVATAEDTELAGKEKISWFVFFGDLSPEDVQDGKGVTTMLQVYVKAGEIFDTLEKPVKYRISWSSSGKWLSHKKPNPDHLRRGNLFFDADGRGWLNASFKVALPEGVLRYKKVFRVRVRAFYADKTRDECVKAGGIIPFYEDITVESAGIGPCFR